MRRRDAYTRNVPTNSGDEIPPLCGGRCSSPPRSHVLLLYRRCAMHESLPVFSSLLPAQGEKNMRASWFLNCNFAALWLGQSVSQLGDALIEVTFPIWVGILTNDPTHVAVVAATEVLPAFCIGPLAGACADRWNPRTTMMVWDLLRAIL